MRDHLKVVLWGRIIGYLGYPPQQRRYATFEFDRDFMASGIQLSPVHLNYPPARYTFDQLSFKSFHGLPGFIADSLPDSYGRQLIDIYMAEKGVPASEVTALDRLNYVADRGMGALEFLPGESLPLNRSALELSDLAELAEIVIRKKAQLHRKLSSQTDRASALTMIRIGSSAGGARSKAIIALSPKGKILDGTVNHGVNYSYWLLKFDSSSNKDKDSTDPEGMPVLEYIYSLIAREAGIHIPATRLLTAGSERHFIIERFDRIPRNGKLDKLHYGSWSGLGHADRDAVNSYEQLVLFVRQMGLGRSSEIEIFKRAVFNILGRNQDDHTKNTGFLMNRSGKWSLAPAFDLTYSYDPAGRWTRNHQCWLNGKNNDFLLKDLTRFGEYCNLSEKESLCIIRRTAEAFSKFPGLAGEYDLSAPLKKNVEQNLRLGILNT
ncbi:MAG: type II toxin-antitoxin system HipA family toxin [Spirochaetales bacterium]|nr:type II toxin-antitoxin system HipA family toxin [Spirochaetales bacterium]